MVWKKSFSTTPIHSSKDVRISKDSQAPILEAEWNGRASIFLPSFVYRKVDFPSRFWKLFDMPGWQPLGLAQVDWDTNSKTGRGIHRVKFSSVLSVDFSLPSAVIDRHGTVGTLTHEALFIPRSPFMRRRRPFSHDFTAPYPTLSCVKETTFTDMVTF